MKKTALTVALTAMLGVAATGAQAYVLNAGDMLTINSGTFDDSGNFVPGSGSWFGMDANGNGAIASSEQSGILYTGTPITIGQTSYATGSHSGSINNTESPSSTIWEFFGNTGMDYHTVAPTGSTTAGLNWSGWTVTWNGIQTIPMGATAWTPSAANCAAAHMGCTGVTFAEGTASFAWDGVYGSSYVLWYTGTVPLGDASGFGGVRYILKLTGTVQEGTTVVPVPAAAWLLGSGLIGLVGVARRKAAKA